MKLLTQASQEPLVLLLLEPDTEPDKPELALPRVNGNTLFHSNRTL